MKEAWPHINLYSQGGDQIMFQILSPKTNTLDDNGQKQYHRLIINDEVRIIKEDYVRYRTKLHFFDAWNKIIKDNPDHNLQILLNEMEEFTDIILWFGVTGYKLKPNFEMETFTIQDVRNDTKIIVEYDTLMKIRSLIENGSHLMIALAVELLKGRTD